MLLKKQTVWLLTMLSLVIVLSVYYITQPNMKDEYALMTQEEEKSAEQASEDAKEQGVEVSIEEMEDGTVTSGISSEDLFTALRMDIDEERSKEKEELQAIAASSDVTAEKRSEALDKMQDLHTYAAKEAIIETMILANENYADALVKAEEDQVRVYVKSKEEGSKQAANEIMRLVRDELGQKKVAVEFQPIK